MKLNFFVTVLTLSSAAFAMNHPEAVQRCETRVNLLKGQTERVTDPTFKDSLKKIMGDMDQTLVRLKTAKTAQDIFALSNECHNGARSAEWMVERYGKTTPAGLQTAATQKPLEQAPQVESLLTNTAAEVSQPAEKAVKSLPEKKAASKKNRRAKVMKAKHKRGKSARRNKSTSSVTA